MADAVVPDLPPEIRQCVVCSTDIFVPVGSVAPTDSYCFIHMPKELIEELERSHLIEWTASMDFKTVAELPNPPENPELARMAFVERGNLSYIWNPLSKEWLLLVQPTMPQILKTSELAVKGWYINLEEGKRPSTGWFYQFDPEDECKIRTETSCGDTGPFDDRDRWIGPVPYPEE